MAHFDWPDFGYSRDPWNVYYNGRLIDGVSSTSFRLLGDGYAKDPWNVYFMGRRIEVASPLSFEPLGGARAIDAFDRYYCGQRLNDPFPPMRPF